MIYKILFFIFVLQVSANDVLDSGSWFTKEEIFPEGFEYNSIYFQTGFSKNQFILSKLSYNNTKFWEESRMTGKIVKISGNEYLLNGEICSVYASKELGKRWVLFRSVDCDHHKFVMKLENNQLIIQENYFSKNDVLVFNQLKNNSGNKIQVISFLYNQTSYLWGIEIRKLRKNAKLIYNNKSIELDEIVDSTARIKKPFTLNKNEILLLENPKTESFFD